MTRKSVIQIFEDKQARSAEIRIYGTINSSADKLKAWYGKDNVSDVSAFGFAKEIEGLDVDTINVCINSYGGEVAEALAIYSALTRHKAEVHTFNDGFCCSAATIIFCAGAKRTAGKLSLMMIHNCRSYVGYADSDGLRKAAEDNDKINGASIQAYKSVSNLPEETIRQMMDKETWLDADECVKYGFATDIMEDDAEEDDGTVQSAFGIIRNAIMARPSQDAIMEKLDKIEQLLTPTDMNEGELRETQANNKRAAEFFANLF